MYIDCEYPMGKKCILILLDGLGDRSYEVLEYQTPLEAALTPVLDSLTSTGACGLYHAGAVGQALPSENAHFAIFGYDRSEFPGRGALEALGAGIPLDITDVAVLGHLTCLKQSGKELVLDIGKPTADKKEIAVLFEAVKTYENEKISLDFIHTHGISGLMVLKGTVSPYITDTDPMINGRYLIEPKPLKTRENHTATLDTVNFLKQYLIHAHQTLNQHPLNRSRKKKNLKPINGIVTQRAGQLKPIISFSEKYGLKGCSIASGLVYHGMSKYLGLDAVKIKDTDDPGSDISHRISLAYDMSKDYDFIHVHTKAPDEAAHKKDPVIKRQVIELLDKGIGEAIDPLLNDPDILVIVTSDHSTPSSGTLIHSGETVPIVFNGQGVRRDAVHRFNETDVSRGALGCIRGKELMYLLLNHLDRSKLMGLMDTPVDQVYWPGNYETFRLT